MKKLIILLLIGLPLIGHAQLNKIATGFKKALPQYYQPIKENAVEQWGNNHVMVVAQINQQCEALWKFMEFTDKHQDDEEVMKIVYNAILTWKEEEVKEDVMSTKCNWIMVYAEIKNQSEASKQY